MDSSVAAAGGTRKGRLFRSLAAVPAGGLVALVTITYTMSYAALVFSGGLAPAYGLGLSSMLMGCVLCGVLTALCSSIPFAVSAPDSNVVAILAASLAPLAWQVGRGADPEALAATSLLSLVLATLAVGFVMGGLGLARAGRLVRFLPFPVIAGFLGGSGWFLVAGGAGVAAGLPGLEGLLEPERRPPLAAALAGGAALLAVTSRKAGPFSLPWLILGGVLLHHAIAAWLGIDLATQAAAGWLPPAPDRLAPPLPWDPAMLALVDWDTIIRHLADLPMIVLVTTIGLLMNVSGAEAATGRDAEIDRELRVAGGAALAAGAAGGLFGLISPGRSLLLWRTGGNGRLGGVVGALLVSLLPLLMPQALRLVPRWVLGALLVFLGLDLLRRWVMLSRRDLSLGKWLQVVAVAGVTIGFGFLLGLIAGLVLACGHFIALYGRASPIRNRYDGTVETGHRARPEQDRAALDATGTARLILHLQGFLFFGTANRLVELVRAELAWPAPLTHLLLDFREVVGLDSSAAMAFTRLRPMAAGRGVTLVLTALAPHVSARLGPLATDPSIRRLPTLQDGVDWMEEDALASLPPCQPPLPFPQRLATLMGEATAARFLAALPEVAVPPGTTLMVQDEGSDDMVLLEEGEVTIRIRSPGRVMLLRVQGSGVLIGEMGFLLGLPRTATVTTEVPCRLRRLTRADLSRLERDEPELAIQFHRLMARLLAGRIQDKDRLIAGLLRGMRQPA
ncbi:cyclic nucleotide-binding domain-containing protein [Dankookia rubra]|uniref:Cyclic nucleotide-binding domain-containing protein n=1 Tax=Dankookia rubra TaxID=1442381 RepID=A0A4R5QJN6_9PROT|nr:SulP family inorganic anion transporter [Dankookia rubra]TDH63029.1 cyclic nucleotide-binding domain-containing protein [Dankookia rubra]